MAAVALVDVDALDLPPGHGLRLLDHRGQRVSVARIARQGIGVEDDLTALAAAIGGGVRDLHAEVVRRSRFALAALKPACEYMPLGEGLAEIARMILLWDVQGLSYISTIRIQKIYQGYGIYMLMHSPIYYF